MKILVLAVVAAVATAATLPHQGYNFPQPSGGGLTLGGSGFFQGGGSIPSSIVSGGSGFTSGIVSGGSGFTSGIVSGGSGFTSGGSGGFTSGGVGTVGPVGGSCPEGQLLQVDGSCVEPIVRRNLFVYRAPAVSPIVGPRPDVPPPRVEHNVVFIHTSNSLFGNDPVVVPPPQQKNVIYVLNKRPEIDHSVLEFPPPEQVAPEIFFINYADGENPTLPSGGDLQSALSQAAESNGEVIGHRDAIIPVGSGVGVIGGVGVTGGVTGGAGVSGLYTTP